MESTERRAFFGVIGLTALPLPVHADEVCTARSPQPMIKQNRARAELLLHDVFKVGDLVEQYPKIVRQEIALRFDLATYLDAHSSDDSIHGLIDKDYLKGLQAIRTDERKLDKSALLPVRDIARQAGQTTEDPTPPPVSSSCTESRMDVVIDMFIAAMELQEVGGAFKRVVAESPELRDAFKNLAEATGTGDWQKLLDAITKLFGLIGQGALAKAAWDKLGKKAADEVKAKLLRSFLARLVPFVGQIYGVIGVATAILANRRRLMTTIDCRRRHVKPTEPANAASR